MRPAERIALAFGLMAVNPYAWLGIPIVLIAACFIVPVLLGGWLLLKLAEVVFAKPKPQQQLLPPQAYLDTTQRRLSPK